MINLKGEEGLTLVETIIALVLMLVLMAAFAGAMVVGLQSEVEVDKRLEASNLASGVIESLSDVSLNGVDTEEEYYIDIEKSEVVLSFDDNDREETININEDLLLDSINDSSNIIIDPYSDGLYKITVNISWNDRGNIHDLNIVTLLAAD